MVSHGWNCIKFAKGTQRTPNFNTHCIPYLWSSSCSQGGPLQGGVLTVTSYSYPKNFPPCQHLSMYIEQGPVYWRPGSFHFLTLVLTSLHSNLIRLINKPCIFSVSTARMDYKIEWNRATIPGSRTRGGPPPNDYSAHAWLRGLSDPALSLSGIGGISGSEGQDYLMITENDTT